MRNTKPQTQNTATAGVLSFEVILKRLRKVASACFSSVSSICEAVFYELLAYSAFFFTSSLCSRGVFLQWQAPGGTGCGKRAGWQGQHQSTSLLLIKRLQVYVKYSWFLNKTSFIYFKVTYINRLNKCVTVTLRYMGWCLFSLFSRPVVKAFSVEQEVPETVAEVEAAYKPNALVVRTSHSQHISYI